MSCSRFRLVPAVMAALLLLPSGAARAGADEAFLAELEDLPLAPGLTEQPGGLLFDSADGRIIEATATGSVGADSVRQFYLQSLQQLGWSSVGPMQFRRDTERLTIVLDDRNLPLTVRFTLAPAH